MNFPLEIWILIKEYFVPQIKYKILSIDDSYITFININYNKHIKLNIIKDRTIIKSIYMLL